MSARTPTTGRSPGNLRALLRSGTFPRFLFVASFLLPISFLLLRPFANIPSSLPLLQVADAGTRRGTNESSLSFKSFSVSKLSRMHKPT